MDSGYVFVYNPFATIQKVKILLLELFWLWVDLPKGFNCDRLDGLFLVRAVAVVPADADDAVCFLHTGDHLAERCVLPVQMRSILHHNEKLRAGRIGIHGPRHREDSTCMLQRIRESISREFAFDAISRTTHAGPLRITALDHKPRDDAVKNGTIVKSPASEGKKIIYGIWSYFWVEFCLDGTFIRFDCNDRIFHIHLSPSIDHLYDCVLFHYTVLLQNHQGEETDFGGFHQPIEKGFLFLCCCGIIIPYGRREKGLKYSLCGGYWEEIRGPANCRNFGIYSGQNGSGRCIAAI